MKTLCIFTILFVALANVSCQEETVDAIIYADNIFEFYVDGKLVKKDPLDFTPHNAVKFSFKVQKGQPRTYAIKASDFATESGYEYTSTTNPQLGDGALRMVFSDGTISSSDWKCFTTSFGPTEDSIKAGCTEKNIQVCKVQITPEPANWMLKDFDDSKWSKATLYTEQQAGWGMAPKYANGKCGTLTDPLTRNNKSPDAIVTEANECLDPRQQSWGNSQFIWQADLKKDNQILCRYVNSGTAVTSLPTGGVPAPSSSMPPSNTSQFKIALLKIFLIVTLFLVV